ncbi:MAG: hypothetical protein NXI18_11555 [Alphaproteobacteria bacterium]|nr:hypothetical protein [Alphaproteobacteria bacterium]
MAHPSHLTPPQRLSQRIPICRLTTGEALIVWAIRHWVQSVKARLDPRALLTRGFSTLEAGDSTADDMTEALDRLLMITLEEATTVRDVGCVRCPTLGDGEQDVLRAIALAQRGRRDESLEVVQGWLPTTASLTAYMQIATLARSLDGADLRLPLRQADLDETWWMDALATHPRPSALIH